MNVHVGNDSNTRGDWWQKHQQQNFYLICLGHRDTKQADNYRRRAELRLIKRQCAVHSLQRDVKHCDVVVRLPVNFTDFLVLSRRPRQNCE